MRTSLSYFEACLKAAAWPETLENAYEKSWELFRETQHMQPDRDAIEVYVMNKLNLEKDAVELVPATATANVYKAWHELQRKSFCPSSPNLALSRWQAAPRHML